MPIELVVWRMDGGVRRVEFEKMASEQKLEDLLESDLSILAPGLMLIGRQIATAFGKFIDLLAMDADGNLHVIELKRDKTPRDVVAQLLDYASWVEDLSYEDIGRLYQEKNQREFEEGFGEAFDASPPQELNQNHEMIVVATELDASTERIINYLSSNYGVPVNAVFFRHFRDGDHDYLARTWLIDPAEIEATAKRAGAKKKREPWNGRDFYVSLGEGPERTWDDCRRYGFISGGQGKWYSQTLQLLSPEARVFVNIPKTGFVGVGVVKGRSTRVRDFKVEVDGEEVSILDLPTQASDMGRNSDDPELSEYLVEVEWDKTVSKKDAYWEKGLFAVQHTACRLRNQFTIERLTQHFQIDD